MTMYPTYRRHFPRFRLMTALTPDQVRDRLEQQTRPMRSAPWKRRVDPDRPLEGEFDHWKFRLRCAFPASLTPAPILQGEVDRTDTGSTIAVRAVAPYRLAIIFICVLVLAYASGPLRSVLLVVGVLGCAAALASFSMRISQSLGKLAAAIDATIARDE